MPISVTCPECEAPYKVPDEAAGKAIKCKKCGAKVPVPSGEGGGGDDFANLGDKGGNAPPQKKSNVGKILAIVGGLLAVTCCLCGGGGAAGFYFFVYKPGLEIAKGVAKDIEQIQKDLKNFDKNFDKPAFDKPAVVAGGPTIFEKKETLTAKDPQVNGRPSKSYKVKLEGGKDYIIDMKAVGGAQMLQRDPFLALLDAKGKEVANDDDGGGNFDAQIRFRPPATGEYTIQATHVGGLPPDGLPFTLTVKLK